jgi:hypothetical protein
MLIPQRLHNQSGTETLTRTIYVAFSRGEWVAVVFNTREHPSTFLGVTPAVLESLIDTPAIPRNRLLIVLSS